MNCSYDLNKSWDHPSNPLFNELNVLPLQCRITYHVALLFFKIHNGLAPNYFNTLLLLTSKSRYQLRSECRPKKKSYYSNLTLQSLSTPIWNNIPEHMKSAITVNTFKSVLKASFLYILNHNIYNYHTQSNCVPVLHFIINYVLFLFIHKW